MKGMFTFLFQMLKTKAIPATTLLVIGGAAQYIMTDVNAKHKEITAKVANQDQRINQMAANQAVVINTLQNINKSLDEVKDSVKNTNMKVWQISRDIKKGN